MFKRVYLASSVALFGACAVEPSDESVDLSTTAQSTDLFEEQVLETPHPEAHCGSSCRSLHVVGEPITIAASYYGRCEWLYEYPCHPQPNYASITCLGASCTVSSAGGDEYERYYHVTPTTTGTLTIQTNLGGKTFYSPPITSVVPDGIAVSCETGWELDRPPCVAGENRRPVWVNFSLTYQDQRVYGTEPFAVTDDGGGNAVYGTWFADTPGAHTVTGRYGALERQFSVRVKGPSPHAGDWTRAQEVAPE